MRLNGRLSVVVAVLLTATSCVSHVRQSGHAVAGGNPSLFLTVDAGASTLNVRSIQTGSVVRTLASGVGDPAMSPDGTTAYYDGGPPLEPSIFSVPVAGGAPVKVGSGRAPAVSPDNSMLAYILPFPKNAVGIYDAAHRATQQIDLSQVIGSGYHLANSGSVLAWASDTLLVAIPLQDPTSTSSTTPKASPGTSSQTAVVINLAAGDSTRAVTISSPPNGIGGPGSANGTILVATGGAIDQYAVTPSAMTQVSSVPVPSGAQVAAISPDGDKVLYLIRSGPSSPPPTQPAAGATTTPTEMPYQSGIQLWEAAIDPAFSSRRPIIRNAQLYGASW